MGKACLSKSKVEASPGGSLLLALLSLPCLEFKQTPLDAAAILCLVWIKPTYIAGCGYCRTAKLISTLPPIGFLLCEKNHPLSIQITVNWTFVICIWMLYGLIYDFFYLVLVLDKKKKCGRYWVGRCYVYFSPIS